MTASGASGSNVHVLEALFSCDSVQESGDEALMADVFAE